MASPREVISCLLFSYWGSPQPPTGGFHPTAALFVLETSVSEHVGSRGGALAARNLCLFHRRPDTALYASPLFDPVPFL